ncbi:MAG TPA: hypothetical protein GXZ47_05385 [Treponema sp.]|nr:hypothetical protein [Treponema sp.]
MKPRESGKNRKTLTARFLYRAVLSLTVFSVGLTIFFFFGNIQQFLDSTQILIITILSFSAGATVLAVLPLLIPEIILAITQRRKKFVHFLVISLICLGISLILAVMSQAILILSRGM